MRLHSSASRPSAGTLRSIAKRPGRTRSLAGLIASLVLFGSLAATAIVSASTPVTVGTKDFAYGGGASRVTSDKPQSKLWYTNDGGTITWWGGLFTYSAVAPTKSEFHIWKMTVSGGVASNTWTDTGTVVDTRDQSNADYFYDPISKELYVVSAEPTVCSPTPCDNAIKFFRYTYNSTLKTYTKVATVDIATGGATTASVAKDSTGQLWIVYPQGVDVKIAHTNDLNIGANWSVPIRLPSQAVGKDLDPTKAETAAIVAFGGNAIGVMWSNHALATPQTSFAVHADASDPVTGWPATPEAASSGAGMSDNHINLKSDSAGHLYAVTKTTLDGDPIVTKDLILLLDRPAGPAGQTWTRHTVSSVADLNTRPQLLLDEELGVIYVFMTAPNGGGAVYYKSAPLTGSEKLTFATGNATVSEPGTPFIKSATEITIDDSTTTKQVVDHTTGILVEASDHVVKQYLHNALTLPAIDADAPTGLTPVINAGALDTNSTAVSVAVSATDAGSGMSLVRLSNTSTTTGPPAVLSGAGATSFVYNTPVPWTLSAGADGVRTVFVQWRDSAGHWSAVQNDTIDFDTTKPTGTVAINGGATDTNSTAVTLALTATDGAGSGVTTVSISNSADMSGAASQPLAASVPWTLVPGTDGTRTVYVQYTDAAGNISDPGAIFDTINLDSTPPAAGTVAIGGGPVVSSVNVTLTLAGAGGDAAAARVSNSSDMSGATAISLSGGSWTLAAGADGPRTVYAQWADALGNWSAAVASNTITLDQGAPSGTVSINAGAAVTNSLTASVGVPSPDGDVTEVRISNTATTSGSPALLTDGTTFPYTTPVAWTLSAGDGTRTVYAQWRDGAGNWSTVASDTIILDTVRPTAPGAPVQRFVGGTASGIPVRLVWPSGTDAASGVARYILQRKLDTGAFVTIANPTSALANVGVASGHTYTFRVASIDGAGNVSPFATGRAFKALGYSERSTAVRYRGTWILQSAPALYGGRAKYTRARLASSTFTFTGRNIAWVATMDRLQGRARVYVDGRLVTTVNLNSAVARTRQIVFVRAWAVSRTHTVRIVGLATAGHPRVTVDAFFVLR